MKCFLRAAQKSLVSRGLATALIAGQASTALGYTVFA